MVKTHRQLLVELSYVCSHWITIFNNCGIANVLNILDDLKCRKMNDKNSSVSVTVLEYFGTHGRLFSRQFPGNVCSKKSTSGDVCSKKFTSWCLKTTKKVNTINNNKIINLNLIYSFIKFVNHAKYSNIILIKVVCF